MSTVLWWALGAGPLVIAFIAGLLEEDGRILILMVPVLLVHHWQGHYLLPTRAR